MKKVCLVYILVAEDIVMVQAYIFSLLSFSLYFQSSNSISDSISFLFSSFQFHTHARGARDLIFFLQRYDVFLQVACVFSKFRPRACTYRLDPDSCRLAYGTAPFGPIECKQLLLDVSCVSVHSRCTTSHMAGAYTLSFFEIRGRTVQPRPSRFGLSK